MTALRKTAQVVRLHGVDIELKDRARIVALLQQEIFRCGRPYGMIAVGAGIAYSTVQNLARGETKTPSTQTMLLIGHELGIKFVARLL